jgi:hypothetical protein
MQSSDFAVDPFRRIGYIRNGEAHAQAQANYDTLIEPFLEDAREQYRKDQAAWELKPAKEKEHRLEYDPLCSECNGSGNSWHVNYDAPGEPIIHTSCNCRRSVEYGGPSLYMYLYKAEHRINEGLKSGEIQNPELLEALTDLENSPSSFGVYLAFATPAERSAA